MPTTHAFSLERLAAVTPLVNLVRVTDIEPGDLIIVRTKNSTYCLRANGDGTYDASGGWFSRHRAAGQRLRIAGCTWGGSALLTVTVAAPGMYLEFENRVRTTRIREVRHIRPWPGSGVH